MDMREEEKREFVRVPFRMETSVRTADRTIWSGSTLDISMSGLRVATTDTVPPEGTPCEIEIVLADDPSPAIIEARGTIVRSAAGTLAVHFTEVDLDTFEHLQQLILNNSADPDTAEQQFRAHLGIRTFRPPEKA